MEKAEKYKLYNITVKTWFQMVGRLFWTGSSIKKDTKVMKLTLWVNFFHLACKKISQTSCQLMLCTQPPLHHFRMSRQWEYKSAFSWRYVSERPKSHIWSDSSTNVVEAAEKILQIPLSLLAERFHCHRDPHPAEMLTKMYVHQLTEVML